MSNPPIVAETATSSSSAWSSQSRSRSLVLLVGSRAYGMPRDDSDYDILLVLRNGADVEHVRRAATNAIRAAGVSVDVLACTVVEYERHQFDPGFIDYIAASHGVVLYATGVVAQRSTARVHEQDRSEGVVLWTRRAESDLRAAESMVAAAEPAWDAICFHSHACVEKLFKALMVKAGTFPPRTHELAELLRRLPADVRADSAIGGACELLMVLLPRARYPDLPEPTPYEARAAIDAARLVYGSMQPRLNA